MSTVHFNITTNHAKNQKKEKKNFSPPSYQQHSCGGCDFSFRTRTELIKHKTESLNDNCHQGLMFCPQCNKGFISQYGLNMHYTKSPSCNILNDLPNAVSTIAFGSGIGPRGRAIPAEHTVASKVPSVNANRQADESDGTSQMKIVTKSLLSPQRYLLNPFTSAL